MTTTTPSLVDRLLARRAELIDHVDDAAVLSEVTSIDARLEQLHAKTTVKK